ncbi:MAG TPA: hypothetical protein VLE43_12255 [Candidatus Saccharimonadia bacterium]|nr:hypothetical protein [Candidatus Saccharimonadia bacterium]
MKTTFVPLALLLMAALSACKSTPEKPEDISYDETLQGTLQIPSYTRNALDGWPEGRKIDPYDVSRVRHPEEVHTYHIGRLPTHDRREMHEAHSVYRVEQSARWDQRLPATPMASRGVVLGIREPEHDPVPKDSVVNAERVRQIELSGQLEKRVALLRDKQEQIEAFLASAPDKNKTIAELQQQNAKAQSELSAVKEENRKAQDELREIKERQAMEEALNRSIKDATKKP